MKKLITIILFSLEFFICAGQLPPEPRQNSIRHWTMLDSLGNTAIESVSYYDPLGRKEEAVGVDGGGIGVDLVRYSSYDRAGRIIRQYCPAPGAGGGQYLTEQQVLTSAASAYSDQKPYQRTDYEQSPLGRPLSVTGAGQAWHNAHKAVTTTYRTNDPSDIQLDCRRFSATDTRYCTDTAITITPMGHYPKGSLHVTVTADEDGHTEIQFTDKQGRTVLTREVDGNTRHDTYHVYDAAGRLTAVLPPKLSAAIDNSALTSSSSEVRELAYLYIHDWQGRCRAKKLPGCSWRTMAYGKGGDAVLVQDGILRGRGKSTFRLADAFGRECVSGITSGNVTVQGGDLHVPVLVRRDPLSTSLGGYVIDGGTLTVDGNDILQVNYYDDYDFLSIFTAHSDSLAYRVMNGYDNKYQGAGDAVSARGMLTGTATRVLNTSGNGGLLVRSMYYDLHGNIIQSHEQNHLGGYEHYYYHLTFTGKPLKVMYVHTTPDTTNTDIYEYTYDNMERLLTATVRHDGASAVTLCQNTYNSLGQLATHSLGSSSQGTISYTYNVRGWPTAITSTPFKQWLHYQDTYGTASPCWNGNVSAMEWESLDALIATQPARHSYAYTYDGLNRLTAAAHEAVDYDNWSGSLVLMNEPDYSCTYDYDLNGNITSLTRKGVGRKVNMNSTIWVFGEIDHLSMTYDGNRLRKATDQCAELTYAGAMDFKDGNDQNEEYTYDRNGNMTSDRNKGIYSITYNELNLPARIEYYDGHEVQYTYAADGRKLHVEYVLNPYAIADDDGGGELPAPDPEGPEGLAGMAGTLTGGDGLQSFDDDPIEIEEPGEELLPQVLMTRDWSGGHVYRNGALERIENEYGYWADSCYHYRIADYQGNVRAVISQNGVLEEVNGYYPYGGITGAPATGVQPLKYGGKELDRENGLDWLDSQARMYDPLIGRTPTQDPLAEKYYNLSPYLWCAGNPVNYVDFGGDSIIMRSLANNDMDSFNNLLDDLQSITGLSLLADERYVITFKTDEQRQPIFEKEGTSETARNFIIQLIEQSEFLNVTMKNENDRSRTPHGGTSIRLSKSQISKFIDNSHNLNPMTLGWGMVFFHESRHTKFGGSEYDATDNYGTGVVVDFVNKIRKELGKEYGQRLNYMAIPIGEKVYIPFDIISLDSLKRGFNPPNKSKFIEL